VALVRIDPVNALSITIDAVPAKEALRLSGAIGSEALMGPA